METLIWVLLIVLLYLFFFWDPKSQYDVASDKKQSIAPNIIQAVIEAIQKDKPDEVPLETLFVNAVGKDTYSCRFMFLNTQGYFGTQYDVSATITPEGSVTINQISTSARVDNYDAGFTPYKPDTYMDYTDITKSADNRLQQELTNYREKSTSTLREKDVFATENVSNMYGQNIQNDKDMQKFLQGEPQTSFTNKPSASSYIPGPSPVRTGNIVAPGAPVFNSA